MLDVPSITDRINNDPKLHILPDSSKQRNSRVHHSLIVRGNYCQCQRQHPAPAASRQFRLSSVMKTASCLGKPPPGYTPGYSGYFFHPRSSKIDPLVVDSNDLLDYAENVKKDNVQDPVRAFQEYLDKLYDDTEIKPKAIGDIMEQDVISNFDLTTLSRFDDSVQASWDLAALECETDVVVSPCFLRFLKAYEWNFARNNCCGPEGLVERSGVECWFVSPGGLTSREDRTQQPILLFTTSLSFVFHIVHRIAPNPRVRPPVRFRFRSSVNNSELLCRTVIDMVLMEALCLLVLSTFPSRVSSSAANTSLEKSRRYIASSLDGY
jgi:hypothetical protein